MVLGSVVLVGPLEALFGEVWESEKVPSDWLKGVITVLPKKGDSLVYMETTAELPLEPPTTPKLFQMVLLGRMEDGLERRLRENQCGFRRGRSCIDQIFSLRMAIHQAV